MGSKSYKQVNVGDWMPLQQELLRFACCDCGLVHTFQMEIRDGKIGYIVVRDERATSQVRRKYNKKLTHGQK